MTTITTTSCIRCAYCCSNYKISLLQSHSLQVAFVAICLGGGLHSNTSNILGTLSTGRPTLKLIFCKYNTMSSKLCSLLVYRQGCSCQHEMSILPKNTHLRLYQQHAVLLLCVYACICPINCNNVYCLYLIITIQIYKYLTNYSTAGIVSVKIRRRNCFGNLNHNKHACCENCSVSSSLCCLSLLSTSYCFRLSLYSSSSTLVEFLKAKKKKISPLRAGFLVSI